MVSSNKNGQVWRFFLTCVVVYEIAKPSILRWTVKSLHVVVIPQTLEISTTDDQVYLAGIFALLLFQLLVN